MAPELKHHVVIFPHMAQGHTIPLVDLSKALSKRGLKVTIITTPSNAISIAQSISHYPNITILEIPFPSIHGLPKGTENTIQLPSMAYLMPFLEATKQLKKPFDEILQKWSDSNDLPICVISDFFLGWTLASCQAFGVPRLVFHGMGVLSMALVKHAWVHIENFGTIGSSQPLLLPGMNLPFVLTGGDLPDGVNSQTHDDPFDQFIAEVAEAEGNSSGIVVNSFSELDGNYISALEQFYRSGTKAWCVGPLSLYDKDTHKSTFYPFSNQEQHQIAIKWLDKQTMINSVIYISFGTQADVSDAQLDEVAYGLQESGVPFLWVVRSETWTFPAEIEERVKGRGLVVRRWVDQRNILAHPVIGGFLSHCGWNSVLESISSGVPILAWPLMADQFLNAKFVLEGLEAGIRVHKYIASDVKTNGIVLRESVCQGVRELMRGHKGGIARKKARALGQIARMAVEEGGSSYDTLGNLIDHLCPLKK